MGRTSYTFARLAINGVVDMGRPRRKSNAVEMYLPQMDEHLRYCAVCREAILLHMYTLNEPVRTVGKVK